MIKILYIINSLNTGGAEKLVLETLPLYNNNGLKADVLVFDGKEYSFYKKLKALNSCTIFSLNAKSVYNPYLIFKLIPYLKRYELIHVHLFPAFYWVALAKLLSLSKIKLVYTEHNTYNKRRDFLFFKILDKLIYSFYSKIITISKGVDINLKKHIGSDLSALQMIHNGVALNDFTFAKPYSKEDFFKQGDIVLIQVSSFTRQKDQATLINAMNELPKNVNLLLVGNGPLLEIAKKEVSVLNLESRVKFLGIRMDVPRLLKTADIVVLSSKHEGLSLSSVEALASGKPFIASNVPGLTEVVENAGLLFEQGNKIELASLINHLITDEVYYKEVSKRCLERSRAYDIKFMIEQHIVLYKGL